MAIFIYKHFREHKSNQTIKMRLLVTLLLSLIASNLAKITIPGEKVDKKTLTTLGIKTLDWQQEHEQSQHEQSQYEQSQHEQLFFGQVSDGELEISSGTKNSQPTYKKPSYEMRHDLQHIIAAEQHNLEDFDQYVQSGSAFGEHQQLPEALYGCPQDQTGQFAYALSCNQFWNCWKGRGFLQNCSPGTLFNPYTLECDYASKVKCEHRTKSEAYTQDNLDSLHLKTGCPSGFTGIVPHHYDCSKFINCDNGKEVVFDCGPGTLFNLKINSCDYPYNTECASWSSQFGQDGDQTQEGSSHAYVDKNKPVQCPLDALGLYPHPWDCSKFLNCAHGQTVIQECGPGTHFNPETKVCDFPYNVKCKNGDDYSGIIDVRVQPDNLQCPLYVEGVYPHPRSCSKYVNCYQGRTEVKECPRGLMYDVVSNGCDSAFNVDCSRKNVKNIWIQAGWDQSQNQHGQNQQGQWNQHTDTWSQGSTNHGFNQQGQQQTGTSWNQGNGGQSGNQNQEIVWNQQQSGTNWNQGSVNEGWNQQGQTHFGTNQGQQGSIAWSQENTNQGSGQQGQNQGGTAWNQQNISQGWNQQGQNHGGTAWNQQNSNKSWSQQGQSQGGTAWKQQNPNQSWGQQGQSQQGNTVWKQDNTNQGWNQQGQSQDQHGSTAWNQQNNSQGWDKQGQNQGVTAGNQHNFNPNQNWSQQGQNQGQHGTTQENTSQGWNQQGQNQGGTAWNQQNPNQNWNQQGQNQEQHGTTAWNQESTNQGWNQQGQNQGSTAGNQPNFNPNQNWNQQGQNQGQHSTTAWNQESTNQGWNQQGQNQGGTAWNQQNPNPSWNQQGQNHNIGTNQGGTTWNQGNLNQPGKNQQGSNTWDQNTVDQQQGQHGSTTWNSQTTGWNQNQNQPTQQNWNQQTGTATWHDNQNIDQTWSESQIVETKNPSKQPTKGQKEVKPNANLQQTHVCSIRDFYCTPSTCIPRSMHCDGVKDCPNGIDERNCDKILKEFTMTGNHILAVREKEKFFNVTVLNCAKACLESKGFQCRSFSFRRDDGACFLSDVNIGTSGSLILSYPYDYYELLALTMNCTNLHKCPNQKCISKKQICDGVNDCGDRTDEKGCSAQAFGYEIKLAGTEQDHEGRIEIKAFGQTGYVCDDKFGLRNADVVCKELGFPLGAVEVKGNSFYAQDLKDKDTLYLMDDVTCLGNETSIRDCDFNGWGVSNCEPQEIVGVVCKTPQETCPKDHWKCDSVPECLPLAFVCDGVYDCTDQSDEATQHCDAPTELRLVGGSNKHEGRVEVRHYGIWGTVCDDDFNDDAAKVVCKYLGYPGKAVAKKDGGFGPGTGPIWLDQVYCQGNESALHHCVHWNWGEHNCEHSEDVGVVCSNNETLVVETERKAQVQNIPESVFVEQCGLRKDAIFLANDEVHFRVVGGAIANKGDYPWQASLRIKNQGQTTHWCGAVVISKKFILTAAHCLQGFSKGAYMVVAGDYNTDEDEGTEQEAYIEEFYIHERFRVGQKMNNDIALIKLKGGGFTFTPDVQPICLPDTDVRYFTGENCTISGFGSIQSGKSSYSHDMRGAYIPLIAQDVCKMPHVYGDTITDGMVCAGSLDEGADACEGDSGGPLACLHEGYFTLYGLTSWGHHCGHANKPGVYVRVAHYRKWIDDMIFKHI